jgi:hypothetical protein
MRATAHFHGHVYDRVFCLVALFAALTLLTCGIVTPSFAAGPSAGAPSATPTPRPSAHLAPAQTPEQRITQPIDENARVTLGGNTRPEAKILKNDRGALPEGYDVDHILLQLQRSPDQEQELEKLIDEMNDRNSPNFHKWLTGEELAERFGVSPEDIEAVTGWLESHGFRINKIYPATMMIDFSGNAGQIRSAFHTEMHTIEVNGKTHIANMSEPSIPAALAPVVRATVSLNDFKPQPMYKVRPDYTAAGCTGAATQTGTCYSLTAGDTETIYNLNTLYTAGYTGTGQVIAVVEDTDTYDSTGSGTEWTTYRNTFGLNNIGPSGSYVESHPGCTDPGSNSDDGEAAIDVEMATTVAPNAEVELISCSSGTVTFGGIIALQGLVNASGPYPGVVSVSYGIAESSNGNGGNAAFFNTYEAAAAEGITVFASAGDEGPSAIEAGFITNYQQYGDLGSLSITGWGETPYNVSVGGTDFEDVYNSKEINALGGFSSTVPISTYWNSTNSSTYESALSYIPEIPWNDSCGSVLIAEYVNGSFQTYGSGGFCNVSTGDSTSNYMEPVGGAGGASNCATGAEGVYSYSEGVVTSECQGYAKPGFQSGSSLTGGNAVYGQPSDSVRDIPDVSMFASNGVWGHFQTVCWNDPNYTADGAAACTGLPSTWSGFGGTSVSSPTLAGVQALVNQYTGESWGIGALTTYYQLAQNEYGTSGGTFTGSSCNSNGSGGPGNSCVFNDVTQGDIDMPCQGNDAYDQCYDWSTSSRANWGVTSTDVVTAATVLWGGSGYTSAPTCTIAGPSNNNPYYAPSGTKLWAGGTQATCTATTSSSSTTAVWTVAFEYSGSDVAGMQFIIASPTGSSATTYTMPSCSSTMNCASDLVSGFSGNSWATCTSHNATVTCTAKTAGAAGNFVISYGTATIEGAAIAEITNTTKGQGPNYVSGITITGGGSGYAPETPITLTGGGGSGALAVANNSYATAATTYQPAYGAAPGWDMATGLGSPNGYNLVTNCLWTNSCQVSTTTAISSSQNPSTYGQAVSFTATVAGNSPTGTVQFTIDGNNFGSPVTLSGGSATSGSTSTLSVGNHTVTAVYSGNSNNLTSTGTLSGGQTLNKASTAISVTSVSPNNEDYAADSPVTITAVLSWSGSGSAPTAGNVVISGNGNGTYSAASCGSASGNTISCTATYTPTNADTPGSYTESAAFSADSNYTASSSSQTNNFTINQATSTTSVSSGANPSVYGSSVTFTATVSGENGFVSKHPTVKRGNSKKTPDPTGSVTWSGNTGCGTTPVSGNPGVAACTTSSLGGGSDTVTATYSGDSNHSASSGSVSQTVNPASQTITFTTLPPASAAYNSQFTVAATASSGLMVYFHASGACTHSGATFTMTSGTGTCTVTATQLGNSNYSAATPVVESVTATQLATSISVTSVNPSSEDYGSTTPVTITAVLTWTGNGAAPTAANVTIGGNATAGSYGTTSCGAASGNSLTCTNTYTPNNDAPGSYTESAAFSADNNYASSSSTQTNNFTINQATSTTAVSSGTNPSVYGSSVTFTATVTGENGDVKRLLAKRANVKKTPDPTGSVTWSPNTGCSASTVTGNPGVATCTTSSLGAGSDTVTASYSGDANHSASSGSVSQTVSQATTTINVTSVSPASEDYAADSPVTITAVLSWSGSGAAPAAANVKIGGNGNGTYSATSCGSASSDAVTCTATYTPTNADVAGSYTESATFSGDTNYSSSNSSQTNNFTINAATTTTSVSSGTNPSVYGTSVTFTATVSGENGFVTKLGARNSKKTPDPTGSVTWSASTGCGTTAVSGNPGVASCTTSSLGAGSDTVTASYSGDANHSASSGSVSQTVNQASQTITFTTNPPASAAYNSPFTVAATGGASGNSVTFTSSGACTNSGATYTMSSGTGTCSVIANQAGSANYSAAPQVTKTVNATKINPTVTFTGLQSSMPYNTVYTVTATTNASTTATITNNSPTVCSLSGTTVTIVDGAGTCSLTANWAADNNYNSASAAQAGTAVKGQAAITWATPSPITYGTPLSATQLDATASPANVYTTVVYAPVAGTYPNAGNLTLKATFTPHGNSNYGATSDTVTLAVEQQPTSTTFTTASETINESSNGVASTVVKTVVSGYKPTGAVTLTASTGETCSGTVAESTGDASCKLTFTSVGPRTISAAYSGNANHIGSSSANTITITVDPH